MSLTSIIRLNFSGSPATVLFAVAPIIINTVNRCIKFAMFFYVNYVVFIHIFLKFLKRLPRALYSTTTVVFEAIPFFIRAPLFDTSKNSVYPLWCTTRSKTVCASERPCDFIMETTARLRVGNFQIVPSDNNFFSACTYTVPKRNLFIMCPMKRFYSQSAHFFSCSILKIVRMFHKYSISQNDVRVTTL